MAAGKPANVHLIPSFSHQELLPDGVHLTPVSGLHYVIHLFDQAEVALASAASTSEARLDHVQETVRHHDDRLVFLESRHGQLARTGDLKVARDAEFSDWMINKSEEDWLTILGLKRIGGELSKRDWQAAAKRQVGEFLTAVLKAQRVDLHFTIFYVANANRYGSGLPILNVQLNSVEVSARFRELYSGFFRKDNPVRLPSSMKGVSVRNKITHDTRIRIEIMKQLGARWQSTNQGSVFHVRGYDPRPVLTLVPAPGSSGRVKQLNFIEAVTTLPPNLSDEALGRIFGVVVNRHKGALRSHFVVLNDDDRERCQELARSSRKPAPSQSQPSRARGSVTFSGVPSSASVVSGQSSGPGSGMDLEAGFLSSLRGPPPPPPEPSARSRSRSTSPTRRGLKRDHQSPEGSEDWKRSRQRSSSSSSSTSSASTPSSSSSSSSSSDSSTSSESDGSHRGKSKSGRRSKSKRSKSSKSKKSRKHRSGKSSKSSKRDRSEKPERSSKSDKSEKVERSDRSDRSNKSEKSDRSEKSDTSQKSDKHERSPRPVGPEKTNRNESSRSEKSGKSDKSSKSRSDKSEKHSKSGRASEVNDESSREN